LRASQPAGAPMTSLTAGSLDASRRG
jgi:hypothetical protein